MKLLRKIKLIPLFSISVIFLLTGCQTSKYNEINKIYQSGNYSLSIEEIDKLLLTEKNGYFQTLALLDRSEAYYRLGNNALERGNSSLAIRLFYLANSDKADERIIYAYELRIKDFNENNQIDNVFAVYNYIINNLYNSPRVPEYLFKRMELNLSHYKDKEKVWEDFKLLVHQYPDNSFIEPAAELVNTFLKNNIDLIFAQKENEQYIDNILSELLYIRSFPTAFTDYINEKIADLYIYYAEQFILQKRYIQAEEYFRKALTYDETEKDYVEKRLNSVCDLFIEEGNEFLKNREIDLAIRSYRRSFRIIPDYEKAITAINKAEQKRKDINAAQSLFAEGQQLQRSKKNEEALKTYRQAFALDPLDTYQRAISEVSNIIEIEKNPQEFALKIIKEHSNGSIEKAVSKLRDELFDLWGRDLRDTGWRAVRAVGIYRMEIRYDLVTPESNYYLAWQVNMRDKQIIPLNKITESLMGQ